MANTFTTNYTFVKPEVGAATTVWGSLLNGNFDSIDTKIKANETAAANALSTANSANTLAGTMLPKAGGTLTGTLTLAGDPSSALQASTKQYVDNAVSGLSGSVNGAGYMPKSGGTFTGDIGGLNLNFTGSLNDAKGNVRSIPQNSKAGAYTLVSSDAAKHIPNTTGGWTVPSGTFQAGDAITLVNTSGSSQTITSGSGLTMMQAGTGNSGNRTLAQWGIATVLFTSSTNCIISGAGIA